MKLGWLMIAAVGLTMGAFLETVDANLGREEIEGTWQAVSVKDSGRELDHESIKNLRWDIAKNRITYRSDGQAIQLTYKLDPTKKPKWIDLRVSGEEKVVILGIYEVKGNDLKICLSEGAYINRRPTEFESKPDSPNDVLYLFKRKERDDLPIQPKLLKVEDKRFRRVGNVWDSEGWGGQTEVSSKQTPVVSQLHF